MAGMSRSRRLLLVLLCVLAGVVLGSAAAIYGAWAYVKSYAESPRLWQDVARSLGSGVEITAASTRLTHSPLLLSATGVEARMGGAPLASIRRLEIRVAPLPLLHGVAATRIEVSEAQFSAPEASATKAAPSRDASAMAPLAALLREVDLDLVATSVRLPYPYLPKTDVELKGSVVFPDAKTARLRIDSAAALGLRLAGELESKTGGPVAFRAELPDKDSLISGKLAGSYERPEGRWRAKGELKLPNTAIAVPAGARWLFGARPVALSGKCSLGGGVAFDWDSKGAWKADSSWDVELTQAQASFAAYEKPAGKTARLKGKFSGTASDWKLSDGSLQLGGASAKFQAEAGTGRPMRVTGAVAPFEIGEFVSMLAPPAKEKKPDPAAPLAQEMTVSGKASGSVDLAFPKGWSGEPSGSISMDLASWLLDGPTALRLAGVGPGEQAQDEEEDEKAPDIGVQAGGTVSLQGRVAIQLEQGVFRDADVQLAADAGDLSIRYEDYFEKKSGVPLTVDLAGGGSGQVLKIKSLRLAGPGGLKLRATGSVPDLKDARVKLDIIDSSLPLETVAAFIPRAGLATGLATVKGEVQGSLKNPAGMFTRLDWTFHNASVALDRVTARKLNGSVESLLGKHQDEGEDKASAAQSPISPKLGAGGASAPLVWLLSTTGLDGQWQFRLLEGEESGWITASFQGQVGYDDRKLSGDMTAKLSEFNLNPWLAGSESEPSAASNLMNGLDFKNSGFHALIRAPRLSTPWLDLSDAVFSVRLGGTSDLAIERLSGHALEGDLLLRGRIKLPSRFEISGSASHVSMFEATRLVGKLSGKDLQGAFYGRGDLEFHGSVEKGVATADFSGKAEVTDGGARFLPVPRKALDDLRRSRLSERLPFDRGDSGLIPEKFEKLHAKFQLKGERLDLRATAMDKAMSLSSEGFVTLSGHCEVKGQLVPSAKMVGAAFARSAEGGLPFQATGDNWACAYQPDYEGLLKSAGVRKGRQ